MTSRRPRAVLVLLLAVTTIAVAGAALDTGSAGGGASGTGDGGGILLGEGGDAVFPNSDAPPPDGGFWFATLLRILVPIGAVATVLVVLVTLFRWGWRTLLERLAKGLPAVLLLFAAGLGIVFVLDLLGPLFGAGGGSVGLSDSGGSGLGGEDSGTVVDLPLPVVALLGGLAVLAVVLVAWFAGDDASDDPDLGGARGVPPEPGDTASPGGARTRSPLDADVPADNEVYRAWLALADAAGATVRRDSPGAVARQAVAAGVDDATASEITALFEAVRYGDAPATPERERRAAEARSSLDGDASDASPVARGEPQ